MTPDSAPKTSTMVVADAPTKNDVTLTYSIGEGPGVRAAQKSKARRNRTATKPKRAMTPRSGSRM